MGVKHCGDDSCDQRHCCGCGCHTVGNILQGGMCYDCWMMADERNDRIMRQRYEQELRQLAKDRQAKKGG